MSNQISNFKIIVHNGAMKERAKVDCDFARELG